MVLPSRPRDTKPENASKATQRGMFSGGGHSAPGKHPREGFLGRLGYHLTVADSEKGMTYYLPVVPLRRHHLLPLTLTAASATKAPPTTLSLRAAPYRQNFPKPAAERSKVF